MLIVVFLKTFSESFNLVATLPFPWYSFPSEVACFPSSCASEYLVMDCVVLEEVVVGKISSLLLLFLAVVASAEFDTSSYRT